MKMSDLFKTNHGVVLVSCCLTMFLGQGIIYSAGVFHAAFLQEMEYDPDQAVWLGSLLSCMYALTGPVASLVIKLFDCRTCVVLSGLLCMAGFSTSYLVVTDISYMFLTYGFVAGLGTGFSTNGSLVVLGYYFPTKTSLASGIAISGIALGIFVWPPMVQLCVDQYGIKMTFLIVGGITLHASVFGMLMRPNRKECEQKTLKHELSSNNKFIALSHGVLLSLKHIVKNVPFIIFSFSALCFSMAITVIYLFLPRIFQQEGASMQEASFVISVSGIGSVVSRLLTGVLSMSDTAGRVRTLIFSALPFIMATISLLISFMNNTSGGRVTYGLLLGLYTGGCTVVMSTIPLDIVGLDNYALGIGLVHLCTGIGALIGPPIAESIYKRTQDYFTMFAFAAAIFYASSVMSLVSAVFRHWHDAERWVETTDKGKTIEFVFATDTSAGPVTTETDIPVSPSILRHASSTALVHVESTDTLATFASDISSDTSDPEIITTKM